MVTILKSARTGDVTHLLTFTLRDTRVNVISCVFNKDNNDVHLPRCLKSTNIHELAAKVNKILKKNIPNGISDVKKVVDSVMFL